MSDPKKDLPKVPPFVFPGASNNREEDPARQPAHVIKGSSHNSMNNNHSPSSRGMLNLSMALISLVSLGIAMLSGAWFAYSILAKEEGAQEEIFSKVVVVGLTFLVGWIVSVFGIRTLGNLILPFVIQAYAWVTLAGIVVLQITIITKLFVQAYELPNFIKYVSIFAAGLIALVGLHLILEKHSLVLFSVPILLTSFVHLFLMVFHYVLLPNNVKYEKLWGDIIFFLITTSVSILMLAHFGLLNGMRNLIDRIFNPKDNRFLPTD